MTGRTKVLLVHIRQHPPLPCQSPASSSQLQHTQAHPCPQDMLQLSQLPLEEDCEETERFQLTVNLGSFGGFAYLQCFRAGPCRSLPVSSVVRLEQKGSPGKMRRDSHHQLQLEAITLFGTL